MESRGIRGDLRVHDYKAKCLHLVYPGLVLFAEFGNGWPLILTPE